jgi:hypothetical protein
MKYSLLYDYVFLEHDHIPLIVSRLPVTGRLMWSARARSAPPSSDINQQLATLAMLLLDAARQAGLFAS